MESVTTIDEIFVNTTNAGGMTRTEKKFNAIR